ncbi:hypothetical protein [Thiomicrorhabdus indica]|uniref:hypothetical protein n=1 Tax=Thiomicrorhabdus indica TaxID=2267253 RepID=UPI002AA852E2|nr:hypothetical protein [Thiomicrorhabdus indica]
MKKLSLGILGIASAALLASQSAHANSVGGVGVGINYGLIQGASLEVNYPINKYFQVRGNFSAGAGLSDDQVEDGILYEAEADGGVYRLSMNYHPFGGNFFLSAGYAVNNFALDASGTGDGLVTVGNDNYQANNLKLAGEIAWDNAPVVTLGWGHSPAAGWGALFEVGVMFTGSPDTQLSATGSVSDSNGNTLDAATNPIFQSSLREEENKLQDDIADADLLPVLQAGVTYRF